MAFKEEFLYLSFGGRIETTDDEWVCGINLGLDKGGILPSTATITQVLDKYYEKMKDTMPTLFTNYIKNTRMSVPSAAKLEYIKLAAKGKDGKYVTDPKYWEIIDVSGSQTGAFFPQIACAITLSSDKRRDPGKNQRFYLPNGTNQIGGVAKVGSPTEKAQITANLISALNQRITFPNSSFRVQPAAVTKAETGNEGYLPITKVRVGNVFDTQRRRRNAIPEVYTIVEVPDVPEETPAAAE